MLTGTSAPQVHFLARPQPKQWYKCFFFVRKNKVVQHERDFWTVVKGPSAFPAWGRLLTRRLT